MDTYTYRFKWKGKIFSRNFDPDFRELLAMKLSNIEIYYRYNDSTLDCDNFREFYFYFYISEYRSNDK